MSEESQASLQIQRALKPEFLTHTKFEEFNLPAAVLSGLNEAGFTYCTPIQAQTLPVLLTGRDVAGQAQTGTGKTAAFLVTVITRLLAQPEKSNGLPSAIIIAPTRELSRQIYEEAKILARNTGLSMAQVVGGVDYLKQAEILRRGVDIIICTPGRIIDYYKQGIFKTEGIKALVIDEADRLLDLGFAKDMRYLLRKLPPYEKRQSMLFSATLSYRVMELTYEYMNLPEFIAVTPETVTVEGIEQELYHVGTDKKVSLLLGLLKREAWGRALIFVNTKIGVDRLTHRLKGNGWPAEGITGDLPQRKRFRLMEQFKKGQLKILVATDVASRGIHVEDISHVINYDLPQESENYIHRIGRTARAGKTGRALSLACERYVFHLESIEEWLGN
ncbi:MAG: DEAD/DEAH box helicase, partial [Desulfobacterales bacterium]